MNPENRQPAQGHTKLKKLAIVILILLVAAAVIAAAILLVLRTLNRRVLTVLTEGSEIVIAEEPVEYEETISIDIPVAVPDTENALGLGDTWVVDGEWSLTITACEEYDSRDPYDEHNPAVTYQLDYSYTNLGYTDPDGIWDGLMISLVANIVDAAGQPGYDYPGTADHFAEEAPYGETCEAQTCIGLDNAGPFSIILEIPDSTGTIQTRTFVLDPQ